MTSGQYFVTGAVALLVGGEALAAGMAGGSVGAYGLGIVILVLAGVLLLAGTIAAGVRAARR